MVDHDVRGLEVLVDHAPLVRESQPLEDLLNVEPDILRRKHRIQIAIVCILCILKHQSRILCEALSDDVFQSNDVRVTTHALCDQDLTHHLLSFEFPKPVNLDNIFLQCVNIMPKIRFAIGT